MKAVVHYTLADGSEDSVTLEGSIDEIRAEAQAVLTRVGGSDPWSEILGEQSAA